MPHSSSNNNTLKTLGRNSRGAQQVTDRCNCWRAANRQAPKIPGDGKALVAGKCEKPFPDISCVRGALSNYLLQASDKPSADNIYSYVTI